MARTSMSLPRSMIDDLGTISKKMGITKSALLVQIAEEPIRDLAAMVSAIPSDPQSMDATKLNRLNGQSVELIEKRYKELKELMDGADLFSGIN